MSRAPEGRVLALVPPGRTAPRPGMTAAICTARALLGDDAAHLGPVYAADPRYWVGRLQQALTAILAGEIPPADTRTALLGEALQDAIVSRQRTCQRCPPGGLCDGCTASWDQAGRYHVLARELGAFGDPPGQP